MQLDVFYDALAVIRYDDKLTNVAVAEVANLNGVFVRVRARSEADDRDR